ncbi:cupin domain-containing protein [Halomarina ordinaria]|uniref:Cupin domain-containing protein n=1 Tax=Halomarina ordinaria TaxID=3033939 RepID=A0ABD5U333_9EURY|nr:cupin domain-containing protein [Halomarina sp. PSRA2]
MDVMSRSDRDLVDAVEGVSLGQLVVGEEMSVQYFRIEPGAEVPEHSHPHEQTGYVTAGVLTFVVDGEEREVGVDDAYVIPGGEPHAARNDGDDAVEGVDVFSPPRLNADWSE